MTTKMDNRLKISLLGGVDIQQDGQPWSGLITRKVEALLIYLVCTGQPQAREVLAELLWPERSLTQARSNLRTALSRLRQTLADYIISTRHTIAFDQSQSYWLDVAELEQQLALARQSPSLTLNKAAELEAAMELYQGDFLVGFHLSQTPDFDIWVTLERERLHRQTIIGLHQLSGFYSNLAAYNVGISWTRRLLTLDELDEGAHNNMLRLLTLNGQRGAALSHYEDYVETLAQEMGIEPGLEIKTLYQQIRAGLFPKTSETQTDNRIDPALDPAAATKTRPDPYLTLSRLDSLPEQKLFGVERARSKVEAVIQIKAQPWLIAIDGIGGIGKTSLAHTVVQSLVHSERFYDIACASAKQEEFRPELGLQETGKPTLDEETLTNTLLHQLDDRPHLSSSRLEKRLALTRLLKEQPYLVVIDNLETVIDYEALLPYLRQVVNPSKVLLTSRLSLKAQPDVYCLSLGELNLAAALALLRYQAEIRGIISLGQASETQLEKIYEVVGGNPLALKLVIGQIIYLPLPQALKNLQQARGRSVHELYTYIYWQAWQMLTPFSRQLLLILPLCPQSTFAELLELSTLPEADLRPALRQLIALSLLEVGGDLAEPDYRLHRLTETFLLNEVLKWQPYD